MNVSDALRVKARKVCYNGGVTQDRRDSVNPLRVRFEELKALAEVMADKPECAWMRQAVVRELTDVGRRLDQWEGMPRDAAA